MQNAEFRLNRYISSSLLKNSTFNIFFIFINHGESEKKRKITPLHVYLFSDQNRYHEILHFKLQFSHLIKECGHAGDQ